MNVNVKEWLAMEPVDRYMAIWKVFKNNNEGRD